MMPKTTEDYARDLIGSQALQIISLRAQLDVAQSRIQVLEQELAATKIINRDEPKRSHPVLTDQKESV